MRIKLEGISKYYIDNEKSTRGVENINLTFESPSFVVITGESGSGKSTLARLLTGMESYDEGEVYFDDLSISTLPTEDRHKAYAKNISFVFQDYNVIDGFTARDNIVLALLKQGFKVKDAKAKADEALEKVGLVDYKKKAVNKLSGGERQRVAIARALASDTKVVVFDEPTGNLDTQTSDEIINLIKETCSDKLVIFITHEFSQVKDCVTRHIILKDGQVYADNEIIKYTKDNSEFDRNVKFPIISLAYVTSLFAFKRVGRFIGTFIVFALLSLASFGISLLGANILTTQSNTSVGYQQGNVNEIIDNKNATFDDISRDGFYDINGLLKQNDLYVYDSDQIAEVEKYTIASVASNNVDLSVQSYAQLGSQVSLSLPKGSKIKIKQSDPASDNRADSLYIVVPNSTYKTDSAYYNSILNKEVGILPLSNLDFSFNESSDYYSSSDKEEEDKKRKQREKELEEYKEIVKTCPRFKFRGVYVCENDNFVYDKPYIYFRRSDALKTTHDYLKDLYYNHSEAVSININSQATRISFEDKEFKRNVINTSNELGGLQLKDFGIQDTYDEKVDKLYLSNHWEGKELNIDISDFKFKSSDFDCIEYIDKSKFNSQYSFFFSGNPFATKTFSSYKMGFAFYDSEAKAKERYEALKDKADINRIESIKITRYSANSMQRGILFGVLYLMLFAALLLALVIFMLIYRSILRRMYFRKAADQNVLHYIGYSKKDIFITNLLQNEAIVIFTNIVVYIIALISLRQAREMFKAIPFIFIFTIVLSLVFAWYVSLPIKSIGLRSKRRND